MEISHNAPTATEAPMTDPQHAAAVPGTWNFRDIGGIAAADGVIRPGVLYRSAALAQLDAAGLRALENLGVSEVFDLRGVQEIAREGADRVPAGVRVTVAPFHPEEDETPAHQVQQDGGRPDASPNGGAGDGGAQDGGAPDGAGQDGGAQDGGAQLDQEHHDGRQHGQPHNDASGQDRQPWAGANRLRAYYAAIPTFAPAQESVAALLRTVATGTGSVLVHCAAGKDRTGWAVATVLRAVGVDQEAVLADYLRSNTAIESLRTWMIAQYGDGARRADKEILGVDESYLRAAWDAANAAFGSFDGYLDAIGIDQALLARLHRRLVG